MLPKTGDVDPNPGLDARDVSYLACHVGRITGYETLHADGDVDSSGAVDVGDVDYLAAHIAGVSGYETLYPPTRKPFVVAVVVVVLAILYILTR